MQYAKELNTRNAARCASDALASGPSTRRWLATAPRRFRETAAKNIAAKKGGEPRFHHSGPYTEPSRANFRQKRPSKRSAAATRVPRERRITVDWTAGEPLPDAEPSGPGATGSGRESFKIAGCYE